MTGTWRLFVYALDSNWRRPLGILSLTGLNVAAVLMVPWPLKWIIDDALGQGSLPPALSSLEGLEPIALIAVLAGIGLLLRTVSQTTRVSASILSQRTGQSMKLALSARAFDHMQGLDHGFFVASRKGDLNQRLNADCAFPGTLLTGVVLPTITAALTMVAVGAIMWGLSPTLALAMIASALPIPFAIHHFQKPIAERSYRQSNELGDLMSLAEQTLTSMPVIQGFNRQGTTDAAFRDKAGSLVDASMALSKASVQINISIGLVQALATAMAMVLGGYLVTDGAVTVGTLVVMLSYLDALYGPIGALAGVSTAYAACIGKARRVGELLDRPSAVRDRPDAADYQPGPAPPELALQDVCFGYALDKYVLDGVTARIGSGEIVALIGVTGAGKSTLASLLTRAIDPSRGAVLIDGIDLRRLRGESLRCQIGVVLQDGGMVPGTVAENIGMFDPAISQAKIEQAARIAQADGFIARMENGYATMIGTGGAGLSGGQKQRIAIARAVAKDAPVLILDEPTSALDVETEAKFFDALTAAAKGRTTLIIAHRLSTLRLADRVLKLENGKITEIAPEEALSLHAAGGSAAQG